MCSLLLSDIVPKMPSEHGKSRKRKLESIGLFINHLKRQRIMHLKKVDKTRYSANERNNDVYKIRRGVFEDMVVFQVKPTEINQLSLQANNTSFSSIFNCRSKLMEKFSVMAKKRLVPNQKFIQVGQNFLEQLDVPVSNEKSSKKHMDAYLVENGINYSQLLTPMQIFAKKNRTREAEKYRNLLVANKKLVAEMIEKRRETELRAIAAKKINFQKNMHQFPLICRDNIARLPKRDVEIRIGIRRIKDIDRRLVYVALSY